MSLGTNRQAIGSVVLAAMCCALSTAAVTSAAPPDDAYLTTIQNQGVPIYGNAYVIALGREVCQTAREHPSMNIVDLAMGSVTSENGPTPYDYQQARVIVVSALKNYCPGTS